MITCDKCGEEATHINNKAWCQTCWHKYQQYIRALQIIAAYNNESNNHSN